MKIKKIRMLLAAMIGCITLSLGSGITAYANIPDGVDTQEGDGVIVEIVDDEDSAPESEADEADKETTESGDGILTPEGNLTLVDDVDEEKSESLQYMTVQTRNGEYFYLIVDRSGNKDNVYFLNMVDEADLISILSEEDQEVIDKLNSAKNEEEEESPIIVEDKTGDEELSSEENTQKKSNPYAMFIIFAVVGAIIAGAYYFFKIKPEKNQIQTDDDLEFYDDEDYINEDDDGDDDTEGSVDDPESEDPEDVLDDDFRYLDFDDAGVDPDL